MNKLSRLVSVISIFAMLGLIVILAYSSLGVFEASVIFFGAIVGQAIVLGSYLSLSQALDKLEK